MRWTSHLVRDLPQLAALTDALAGADLILAFPSTPLLPDLPELLRALGRTGARVVGCTGGSVLAAGTEAENTAAVAILAGWLPDVAVEPFLIGSVALSGPWWEELNVQPEHEPTFLLFGEPHTCDAGQVCDDLDQAFPGCVKLGGLASGARAPGGNAVFLDETVSPGGLVGVVLYGDVVVEPIVAQGCRPIGPAMRLTKVDGNMALELDGGPAVGALEQVFDDLSAADRALFSKAPMVGMSVEQQVERLQPGRFLIRHIMGLDRSLGAIAVAASLDPGAWLQFHVRDAAGSERELRELLSRAKPGAQAALMVSCLGRGRLFYGAPDVDSKAVLDTLGPVALAGFFGNGELGPISGRTHLHGYTSSLALFRPRGWS
jgi:small ligand-binding sensory domain FIST